MSASLWKLAVTLLGYYCFLSASFTSFSYPEPRRTYPISN